MDLQELISRGRFIFAGAPERLGLYKLIDGRKTTADLAKLTKRHVKQRSPKASRHRSSRRKEEGWGDRQERQVHTLRKDTTC